jgi:LmbE family N-acetylglucosaminyl deacetylase
MTHVFVSPHPDDVALSCGGLIASLRELGQNVAILTVFSGTGSTSDLTAYQREALGFGSKAVWPNTEAFNRANIASDYPAVEPGAIPPWLATPEGLDATQSEADAAARRFWQRASWYRRADVRARTQAGAVLADDIPQQGALLTDELVAARDAGDAMTARRLEDERYAAFAEASIVFLDLADAVFRGYEGDEELLGAPRPDDPAPVEILRREIGRLEPQKVYLPLGVGGHVDHRLVRDVGISLVAEGADWLLPGPRYAGIVTFYEDFPYAHWNRFTRLDDLPAGSFDRFPTDVALTPEYAAIAEVVERKIRGIAIYESQIDRLFEGVEPMSDAVRSHGSRIAGLGGLPGYAERYWATSLL